MYSTKRHFHQHHFSTNSHSTPDKLFLLLCTFHLSISAVNTPVLEAPIQDIRQKLVGTTTATESHTNPQKLRELNGNIIACDIYADPIHFSPSSVLYNNAL